jgi:cold shock CspA family protein
MPLVGRVGEFDDARGLGVVEYGESRRFPFHCTAITDGSRQIAVGTLVAIEVSTGRLGHLEAVSVRPLVGMPSAGGGLLG